LHEKSFIDKEVEIAKFCSDMLAFVKLEGGDGLYGSGHSFVAYLEGARENINQNQVNIEFCPNYNLFFEINPPYPKLSKTRRSLLPMGPLPFPILIESLRVRPFSWEYVIKNSLVFV